MRTLTTPKTFDCRICSAALKSQRDLDTHMFLRHDECAAARLYQLAGAATLPYRDVEGGQHVATEWRKLEKKNISEFTPAERKEAAKDFAIHAWLSNWDAAGMGGDNQGVLDGKTTTLDVGGSLRFRAQGGPKGNAFGDKVIEWDSRSESVV